MFSEVEILRDVAITAQDLKGDGTITREFIASRLLEKLLDEKASEVHGYFLAVTKLKSIGRTVPLNDSDNIILSVVFDCRTFIPKKGEKLQGVVHFVCSTGVFLRCGPLKNAYLSARKMPAYHFISGEHPVFVNEELSRIEKNVVLCFSVLDVRWIEEARSLTRDFLILASLDGDSLGPVSLCGSNELDMLAMTEAEFSD